MKRYLLFMGDDYYPEGGMNDFVGDYDTVEDAIQAEKEEHLKSFTPTSIYSESEFLQSKRQYCWSHVYDTESKEKVCEKPHYTYFLSNDSIEPKVVLLPSEPLTEANELWVRLFENT
jgi:hypothetical protein